MEEQKPASEVLRREIAQQSKAEAQTFIDQAEKEKAEVLSGARAEAEKARSETLRKVQTQADAVRKRILSGVHLETKNQDLRAREEAVRKMFALVRDKLDAYRKSGEYGTFLRKLVVEGALALDATDIVVAAGDAEKQLLAKEAMAAAAAELEKSGRRVKLSLSKETLAEGGVMLTSADGRTRFDNTFSARMKRYQDAMRMAAAKALQ
jgi:V/A-type H+/Na+-transporting ATPase subunit E